MRCTFPTSGERLLNIPPIYNDIVRALATSNEETILQKVLAVPALQKATHKNICATINREVEQYCKKGNATILRSKGKHGELGLKEFSFKKLDDELMNISPVLMQCINAAAQNSSHWRNKIKKTDAIKPAILSAAAKLIAIHSEDMNVLKKITSIILKKAGLKKIGFQRLSKTYDCVGYDNVNDMLDTYAENYDETIKRWKEEVENEVGHPGYTLADDNVDWEVGTRQMTADRQRKSVHKINVVAYKNRVDSSLLPDERPQSDLVDVPLQDILPGAADTQALIEQLVVLVGNMWAESLPALSWFKDHIPHAIPHEYEDILKRKTEKTQLGLFNYDQKKVDDVEEFLTDLHRLFVPHHSDSDDGEIKPKKVIIRADYLGFERQKQAQSQVQDARTPSQRLEGFISAMSDFHTQAAWHKVIWYHLYDTLTGREQGTLYHARQVTNSRDVTKDPHDEFYAAEALIWKFTTAYLNAGALHHFGMESVDAEPTLHTKPENEADLTAYVHDTIILFLREHALNLAPSLPGDDELKCRYCSKPYKKRKRLDDHEKKHRELLLQQPKNGFQCRVCGKVYAKETNLGKHMENHTIDEGALQNPEEQSDSVYNYSRHVMTLCCLWLNFEDAIKRGDGRRLMMCYKFMYLHFKNANCPKYAYGSLETICQAHYLLSEKQANDFIWNRFVNNQGAADTNLPVDLDVEHLNKPLKTDLNTFRGEITDKSVQRISRSVEETEKIMANFDRQTGVKKTSGKHKDADFRKDVQTILGHLQVKKVVRNMPGREHMHIGRIGADPLVALDMKHIHTWMKKSTEKFRNKHYYK